MKRRTTSRSEIIERLLEIDENFRRLKEAIERRGGKAPMTQADSDELTRRLEARLAHRPPRAESS